MRFCHAQGIPHSIFLGRVRHPDEPEWTDEDRVKVIAYMIYESERCEMCGTSRWEWDPEHGGSRFAYHPVVEVCPGCERKDWLRDSQDKRPAGSFVKLVKQD